ncbi:MAG TPA: AIR synthase family protein [Bryobacteraceae bacterium]|nr:AIR synthase family protein [Bryobacteraceae bacterium]
MPLPAGKLPADLLGKLLASVRPADPAVLVGPAIGEDAAVLDLGGTDLVVVKTDPITFATQDMGRYLLAVNSNDLATMGARPRWLLVTALLPEGIAGEDAECLFESVRRACEEADVALVGGHTEITVGLDRAILIGCLLGTVARERLVRTGGARVGDALVLAGGIAVEGSAILAREHRQRLSARGIEPAVIETVAAWLCEPGISILPAARALHATGAVHAMHDPTEGGLVTALHELAEAAGVGLRIEGDGIPVLPACRTICEALELDPLGLLASGALVAAIDPAEVPAALDRLANRGIPAARIGEIVPEQEGRTWRLGGQVQPLPRFARDELARYLEGPG